MVFLLLFLIVLTTAASVCILGRDSFENDSGSDLGDYSVVIEKYKIRLGQKELTISLIALLINIAVSLFVFLFYKDNPFVFTAKRLLALSLLWPVAYTDYKQMRIPNLFILAGLVLRGALLIPELICDSATFLQTMLTDMLAAAIMIGVCFLCRLIMKNSIGAGDIKLFAVLALFLGMFGTWGAVFISLIISFGIAIYLLATKKKGKKDSIPFGPAIILGTYISVILTGM